MNLKALRVDPIENLKRVEAIDLFKFIVLFSMIQGHLFRAYLLPSIRQQSWWKFHEIIHGMTAPGFLFAAGFAAFISYYKKKEKYYSLDRAFWRRVQRILFVIWCGYWVHLPFFSLRKTIRMVGEGKVDYFLRADILQCIGTSLLIFVILALLLKKVNLLITVSIGLTLLFFFLAETVRDIPLPYALKAYFSGDVSMFPLFPWAAFLFIGVITAWLYLHVRRDAFFKGMAMVGLLLYPWQFFYRALGLHGWQVQATGMLNRLGGVLLFVAISHFITMKFRGRFTGWLKEAGKESLFVYNIHLFIIYGSFFNKGLGFKNNLGFWEALGVFVAVQAFVFISSIFYGRFKEGKPKWWRAGFVVFWIVFFVILIIRPH